MPRVVAERADALPGLAEVFREHGYEGASLTLISAATGLGKGSLYHFFPGGKEEMMAAVLADIDAWFETEIFAKLAHAKDAPAVVDAMFDAVDGYFRSGQRVCLVGVVGLGSARDPFAAAVADYFSRWIEALRKAIVKRGVAPKTAKLLAEEAVAGIQGAIVLSRALDDTGTFQRITGQLRQRLLDAMGYSVLWADLVKRNRGAAKQKP